MCSSIMYQNMCAVSEFNWDLLLSRRWLVGLNFLIFSDGDARDKSLIGRGVLTNRDFDFFVGKRVLNLLSSPGMLTL